MVEDKNFKSLKIVVFDLDETLGSFNEMGIFWETLEKYYGHTLVEDKLFEVMDLFQEFIRPNIFNILEYIKEKKLSGECDQVMIYTNNQGPKSWVKMISEYFNSKLDFTIFDKIIAAFKVKNKIVEMCRTSHNKSVEDLVRCTKIPADTEICFIDDQRHSLMEQDNVYYINVKPYVYNLPFEEMALRYFNKFLDKDRDNDKDKDNDNNKDKFINFIVSSMKKYNFTVINKTTVEQNADNVISKQLLIHLEEFFIKERHKHIKRKQNRTKRISTRIPTRASTRASTRKNKTNKIKRIR